jgi:pilus assembly protein CpaB
MPRKRIYTVLMLAMTVGAVFAFSTYRYVQATPERGTSAKTTPVVVASSSLDLGAALRAEDLRTINWPSGEVPAGTFSNPQELVGRGLIQPVSQYEPLMPSKLAPVGAGAGLPPMIPDGMRALSVRVNDVIGVAGYVLPGSKVDVLVTVSPTNQSTDMTSKVILTNVTVLTAGTRIERDVEKDNKPVSVSVVTLLVDPLQSEALTLASTEGKIQLALRNPLDKTMPPTPGIRPAFLLGQSAAPRAAVAGGRVASRRSAPTSTLGPTVAPPEPLPTIEIIRGDKRAHEVVH